MFLNPIKELLIPAALLALAVLVGMLTDTLGWCLFFATLVWIGLQFKQYRGVVEWSRNPWRRPTNASAEWFQLAYQPYRALQRERTRSRRLVTQLRQILNLAELIPDGVLVLGPGGEIVGLNKAGAELLQLSEHDMGLVLATVVRNPEFVNFIRTSAHDDAPAPLEFTSPFNPEHMLEARRFNIAKGGMIVLVRDITTLNRLLTVRQSFVANVSHELRTPLSVIQGYLETIADPTEDDDLRLELTHRLLSPVERLQSLVNDLMLLTQLESTEAPPELMPVNLGSVVRAACEELGGIGVLDERLTVSVDDHMMIAGVEAELYSVCVNLVGNAMRYSPDAQTIDINCHAHDSGYRLEVIDHGVGIAPEHLSRLTERFYRVDMADARTRGGTGLGLAIVKHVLRRHNSKLQIESKLGVGSRFFCDFQPIESNLNQSANLKE